MKNKKKFLYSATIIALLCIMAAIVLYFRSITYPTSASTVGIVTAPTQHIGPPISEKTKSNTTKISERGIATGGKIQYFSSAEIESYFGLLSTLKINWVRFDFSWSDIQSKGPKSYNWDKYDDIVKEANARDITVLGMIGYTPKWARKSSCSGDNKCAPKDPQAYATFVSKVVDRYKSQDVRNWEIWNEPNNSDFWKPQPNVKEYSKLLALSYAAAKKTDPNSNIISGGLSPATNNGNNIAPTSFLRSLYGNKAGDSFDALGYHPYCYYNNFRCPTEYAEWSAWSQMNDTPVSMRSIMKANGDTAKKIWATEFGAPTNGPKSVSETSQATMVKHAYNQFSQQEWAGPLFWYSLQDDGTDKNDVEDWFGLLDKNGRQKPAFKSYQELQ